MNIVFGSSGHAKEIYQLTQAINSLKIDYFVSVDNIGEYIDGIKIISEADFYNLSPDKIENIFIGIGDGAIRFKIYKQLKEKGFDNAKFPTLIHPSVMLNKTSGNIKLGIGCVICASGVLTTEIAIGDFVHININSTISHECNIGSFTTISPCCCICGNVNMGRNVFMGASATIIDKVSICDDVIIGAGAVIIKNIEVNGTYFGVPAKKIN